MLTSVNLSTLPFQGSNDSTRAQMASKQMSQALVHKNCEIPYVISSDYKYLTEFSILGIYLAKDDGEVILNNAEIMIIFYSKLDKLVTRHIPMYHKTDGIFSSKLRFSLPTGSKFKKNDILYNYNEFRNGIPSYGYNLYTGYLNFFGYNHEDGIVISENAADKIKHTLKETVYIPVYEYNLFMPMYEDGDAPLLFFPNIGEKIKDNTVCCIVNPKTDTAFNSPNNIRAAMVNTIKNSSTTNLLNLINSNRNKFSIDKISTKIDDGVVYGIKIHKLKRKITLLDNRMTNIIDKMWKAYANHIYPDIVSVADRCNEEYAKYITKRHFVYERDEQISRNKEFKNAVYILEYTIISDHKCFVGDKLCNRYAGKGIVSMIIPDELTPYTKENNQSLDLLFNPFGVFSRMNLSQITECIVGKNVMETNAQIRNDPANCADYVHDINERIIKHLGNTTYYNDINSMVNKLKTDPAFMQKFMTEVNDNNLFIEAPSFSKIDISKILTNSVPVSNTVVIPRETLLYLKDTLKVDVQYPLQDIELKNIFCGNSYIIKLYKLVSELINARDLGPVKGITKQPLKGRARNGGSKIGQMEIEGILAHGTTKALKELITVKCDLTESKKNLIQQLVETGKYNMPEDINKEKGGSIKVVKTLIDFLNK